MNPRGRLTDDGRWVKRVTCVVLTQGKRFGPFFFVVAVLIITCLILCYKNVFFEIIIYIYFKLIFLVFLICFNILISIINFKK